MVGDSDAALDQMEVLLSIPSTHSVATMEANPLLDKVRDLPRYQELIEKFR